MNEGRRGRIVQDTGLTGIGYNNVPQSQGGVRTQNNIFT